MTTNTIDKITLEDLTEEQQDMVQSIGMEAYKNLVRDYGGVYIYIPKARAFELAQRDKQIRERYNGKNARALALQYGLSDRRIQTIVSDLKNKK